MARWKVFSDAVVRLRNVVVSVSAIRAAFALSRSRSTSYHLLRAASLPVAPIAEQSGGPCAPTR